MTSYTLFAPGTSGAGSSIASGTSFVFGLSFEVTNSGMQLDGWWWWVADASQNTAAQDFGLWIETGNGTGTYVAGSKKTSGTLSVGWNFISAASPIALTSGVSYRAVCTVTPGVGGHPFSSMSGYFTNGSSGGNGIVNGPLTGFSDGGTGGTNKDPTGTGQMTNFSGGTDVTTQYPTATSHSWYGLDVQVSTASGTAHTATASLTVSPSLAAGRTRGRFRAGSLAVSPSLSAARARGRFRTAALPLSPSFTAARLHGHGRTAALLVSPAFTTGRQMARVRGGALVIHPSFSAVVTGGEAPVTVQKATGGWWQLLDVYKQQDEEFGWWADNAPFACPRDGEPLRNAPPADSGSSVERYCLFCGFEYPRDWVRPQKM